MEHFSDNLRRLLGLHGLSAKDAAKMIPSPRNVGEPMSESAFAKWSTGQRRPSFEAAMAIGEFFQVPPERLARSPFSDLLTHELANEERFERVESTIDQLKRRGLIVTAEENVAPIKPRRRQRKGARANG